MSSLVKLTSERKAAALSTVLIKRDKIVRFANRQIYDGSKEKLFVKKRTEFKMDNLGRIAIYAEGETLL
jgi:hypothetical protein